MIKSSMWLLHKFLKEPNNDCNVSPPSPTLQCYSSGNHLQECLAKFGDIQNMKVEKSYAQFQAILAKFGDFFFN
jgi:hypothetical protein